MAGFIGTASAGGNAQLALKGAFFGAISAWTAETIKHLRDFSAAQKDVLHGVTQGLISKVAGGDTQSYYVDTHPNPPYVDTHPNPPKKNRWKVSRALDNVEPTLPLHLCRWQTGAILAGRPPKHPKAYRSERFLSHDS
jgi:hypothetical protein